MQILYMNIVSASQKGTVFNQKDTVHLYYYYLFMKNSFDYWICDVQKKKKPIFFSYLWINPRTYRGGSGVVATP